MILNLIVLGLVLMIGYLWSGQGVFSALIHLVCTIAAGAIAFGVWEMAAGLLINHLRDDFAWSLGLAVPFLVALVALRIAADKLIPANLDFDNTTNLIGGGLLGLLSGVVSVGVLVISIGFLRLPPAFLGYAPMVYDARGSVVRGASLWLPADRLAARLYERLSLSGFGAQSPLALRQPDVHEQAGALRMTFDGRSRTTLSRGDFTILGRYTVVPAPGEDLFGDTFQVDKEGKPILQAVKGVDGNPTPPNSRLEGFVIRFSSGAREKSGQIVIGPGQLRLVCGREGDALAIHPIAVVAQAAGNTLEAARFRFDAQEVFIASVGGASEATMAFEFAVPTGATPTDLLVKNVRVPVSDGDPPLLPGAPAGGFVPSKRDAAIRDLMLLGMAARAEAGLDSSGASRVDTADGSATGRADSAISQNDAIPSAFNKSDRGGLDLDEKNKIVDGRHKFARSQFRNDIPRNLKVQSFDVQGDSSIVQVDVSLTSKLSLLGQSVQTAESVAPPVLIDNLGQRYEAAGWIFEETDSVEIRYTRGDPVRALSQIPTLSRSRPDQRLTLLFVVTKGVQIKTFAIGDKAIYEFDPPFALH